MTENNNENNGQLSIETLTILNTLGEIIFSKLHCNTIETIDVSSFAKGIYFVKANNQETKFIKE